MNPRTLLIAIGIGLALAGCVPAPSSIADNFEVPSLVGTWRIEDLPSPASVSFGRDGQVSGTAACNSFTGRYVVSGPQVSFSDMNATALACPHAEASLRRLAPLISAHRAEVRRTARGVTLEAAGVRVRLRPE